jgi:hypothetical protein
MGRLSIGEEPATTPISGATHGANLNGHPVPGAPPHGARIIQGAPAPCDRTGAVWLDRILGRSDHLAAMSDT